MKPIDLPMDLLFGKPPTMQRQAHSPPARTASFATRGIELEEAIARVLALPGGGEQVPFLITIGDRTITGPGKPGTRWWAPGKRRWPTPR